MSVELKTNQAEFSRALEMCIKHSERTYDQFINGHGLALSSRALRATQKADAHRIAHAMGQVSTRFRVSAKTGKMRTKRVFSDDPNTLAARIVNARRRDAGLPLIWGKEMAKAVSRMVGARLRATSFIRSGWIYAIRTLSSKVGYSPQRPSAGESARMKGAEKGYAKAARPAINSVVMCEIGNTALIEQSSPKTGSRRGNPMPVAQRGLAQAFRETSADMLNHLQKKLQPVLNQFSAK